MSGEALRGRRVVIVGASAGLGRAMASTALRAGAEVLLVARREDKLREIVEEHGAGTAVCADITDAAQCQAIAEAAAGPVDLLVVTSATSRLRPMAATTAEDWHAILGTNVVGTNQVIAALVPCMAADGLVAVISSESVLRPRAGLGAYAASKAALELSLQSWRVEHAPLRFTCVAIGATMPTEVADAYDPALMPSMLEHWLRHAHIQAGVMQTDELAGTVLDALASVLASPSVGLDYVSFRSPAPVLSDLGIDPAALYDAEA